jgi:ATP-dependent DNA helicase RecQ
LFEQLRALRKTIAEELKVPPFIIFSDASLSNMCSVLPRNQEEFLQVTGVGKFKLEQYGDDFLKVVRVYVHERGL